MSNNLLAMFNEDENRESWQKARELSKYLGDISTLYFDAIRGINKHKAEINNHYQISEWPKGLQPFLFLFKVSPTLRSILYLACKEFYPDEILQFEKPTITNILPLFTSDELSGIIASAFVYKRVVKQMDPNEWERLKDPVHMHYKLGAFTGDAFDEVGRGNGMFVCGLNYLSFLIFGIHDLKTFQKLRRELDKGDQLFDLKREEEEWGCNHLQVACVIAQKMGFMQPHSFMSSSISLKADGVQTNLVPKETYEEIARWQAAIEMTESLHKNLKIEYSTKKLKPILNSEQEDIIISSVKTIISEGIGLDWFEKTKEDIEEEIEF